MVIDAEPLDVRVAVEHRMRLIRASASFISSIDRS